MGNIEIKKKNGITLIHYLYCLACPSSKKIMTANLACLILMLGISQKCHSCEGKIPFPLIHAAEKTNDDVKLMTNSVLNDEGQQ